MLMSFTVIENGQLGLRLKAVSVFEVPAGEVCLQSTLLRCKDSQRGHC